MKRLIYDKNTKQIITIIDNCENTVTGTPFDIFEGNDEELEQFISDNQLVDSI